MESELPSMKSEGALNDPDTGQNTCEQLSLGDGIQHISGNTGISRDSQVEDGNPSITPLELTDESPGPSVVSSPSSKSEDDHCNVVSQCSDRDENNCSTSCRDGETVECLVDKESGDNLDVKPKIVIESEDQDIKVLVSSDDDDMDPLLAIDDTESQSSDLINLDTVSYDYMGQLGVDDDDDEKSITTMSSLSCDIRHDLPQKLSEASNASSLASLLDSSLKEMQSSNGSPSIPLLVSGSAGNSSSSSPSHCTSKSSSSAIEEQVSEPLLIEETSSVIDSEMNLAQDISCLIGEVQTVGMSTVSTSRISEEEQESKPVQSAERGGMNYAAKDLDEVVSSPFEKEKTQEVSTVSSSAIPVDEQNSGPLFNLESSGVVFTKKDLNDHTSLHIDEGQTGEITIVPSSTILESCFPPPHTSDVDKNLENSSTNISVIGEGSFVVGSLNSLKNASNMDGELAIRNEETQLFNECQSAVIESENYTDNIGKCEKCEPYTGKSDSDKSNIDEITDLSGSCLIPDIFNGKSLNMTIDFDSDISQSCALPLTSSECETPRSKGEEVSFDVEESGSQLSCRIRNSSNHEEVYSSASVEKLESQSVCKTMNSSYHEEVTSGLEEPESQLACEVMNSSIHEEVTSDEEKLESELATVVLNHSNHSVSNLKSDSFEGSKEFIDNERICVPISDSDTRESQSSYQESFSVPVVALSFLNNEAKSDLCQENTSKLLIQKEKYLSNEKSPPSEDYHVGTTMLPPLCTNFVNVSKNLETSLPSATITLETALNDLAAPSIDNSFQQDISLAEDSDGSQSSNVDNAISAIVSPACNDGDSSLLSASLLPAEGGDLDLSFTPMQNSELHRAEEMTNTCQDSRMPLPIDLPVLLCDSTASVETVQREGDDNFKSSSLNACDNDGAVVEVLSPVLECLVDRIGSSFPVNDPAMPTHLDPGGCSVELHQSVPSSTFIKSTDNVEVTEFKGAMKELIRESPGTMENVRPLYKIASFDSAQNEGNLDPDTQEIEKPSSLPDLCKLTSNQCPSLDLSHFWKVKANFPNISMMPHEKSLESKLYHDVAALDKAQQLASCIVDDVLQTAVLKTEEKIQESFKKPHAQGFHAESKAENPLCFERKDSGCHSLSDPSRAGVTTSQDDDTSFVSVQGKFDVMVEHGKALIEAPSEETFMSCSNTSSDFGQNLADECASEHTNISEGISLSDSFHSKEEKEQESTISLPDGGGSISSLGSENSLLLESDLELRLQASLLVDGIIDLAVQKFEECMSVESCQSISVDSCPSKLKSLPLDDDFALEDEELATPCGEMLTEHFMDFESGRNVSVFCSIPESGSEDHLLAYDRIVNTIGNREVDSGTGKSVSVFRSEEEVFYEIQRASTCTSVFESVEEEDEDMIDTTLPLESRPDTISANLMSITDTKYSDKPNIDCDAFEDAVDAFLSKGRQARDDTKSGTREFLSDGITDITELQGFCSELSENASNKEVCVKHPEYDISNQEEKKRMAEKWANGGELEVPNTPEMQAKQRAIREALDSDDDVAAKLCKLALTEGGLINDALRREAWPRMLGLDPTLEIDAPSLEDLKSHPEYEQVVLDVNRSLKRFPPDIPKDRRETLQDKLTRLIMYVISKHPHLRYYQGYHDVAVTFLLVVGESIAFQIMERLSTEHLSDCMQPTMERTSYLLLFIYPLLHRLHPTLADYLERSEVGTMFCLPWFLTWFGHSLDRYQDVVRLYDHFLASPPLAPLYLAAVLVAHRADEVLAVDCDMAAIHALLSHIPDTLPLEILLHDATDLYIRFPPESIEREVEERFRNEQLGVQRQRALRRRRGNNHGSGSWQLVDFQDRIAPAMTVLNRWVPPWVVQQQRLSMRLLFASATFFVGFYVYSRGGDMLPYP